jgi:hypothetical protein
MRPCPSMPQPPEGCAAESMGWRREMSQMTPPRGISPRSAGSGSLFRTIQPCPPTARSDSKMTLAPRYEAIDLRGHPQYRFTRVFAAEDGLPAERSLLSLLGNMLARHLRHAAGTAYDRLLPHIHRVSQI